MTISAKVIEDSIGSGTRRLTTFELKYPRFIHAEFMTHRQFSRNASSSRAIPVETQIRMLTEDTAMPIHWGKNQPGMQADGENDTPIPLYKTVTLENGTFDKRWVDCSPEEAWKAAREAAVHAALAFHNAGYHKQVVNRILEPFAHISVVCTSSQYENFFALRRHPDAQPEIKALADAMFEAMENSTPTELSVGEWHLPYITDKEKALVAEGELIAEDGHIYTVDDLVRCSVARSARVSYLTHDGQSPSMAKDMALYTRLVGSVPLHASPAEHQATPDQLIWNESGLKSWENPDLHGNLSGGWIQFRKTLPQECYDTWDGPNEFE